MYIMVTLKHYSSTVVASRCHDGGQNPRQVFDVAEGQSASIWRPWASEPSSSERFAFLGHGPPSWTKSEGAPLQNFVYCCRVCTFAHCQHWPWVVVTVSAWSDRSSNAEWMEPKRYWRGSSRGLMLRWQRRSTWWICCQIGSVFCFQFANAFLSYNYCEFPNLNFQV